MSSPTRRLARRVRELVDPHRRPDFIELLTTLIEEGRIAVVRDPDEFDADELGEDPEED